jgi:hypothetical protein
MLTTYAAIVFTVLSGIAIVFQACLAAGLPWGAASMGGRFPGKYPPRMRVVAVANMLLLAFLASLVVSKANVALPALKPVADTGIWFVVAFCALGTVLNTITPSKIERIWAPLLLVQLIASVLVALG